jgi:hypothetical protein
LRLPGFDYRLPVINSRPEGVVRGAICNRIVLACSIGLSAVVSAYATDINGAWVKNVEDWGKRASICSRALFKENNKLMTYERGVVVIDDQEVRAKTGTCRIKARKDDGHFVRLLVECPAEIAEVLFNLRVDGPDKLTRLFVGMPQMSTSYFRCPH